MASLMEPLPTTGLADEVLKDAPEEYHQVIYDFLTPTSVERLIGCASDPYVWDVEVFAHYFAADPPVSDVVAMQSFGEAMKKRYVGQYLIVNPPEVGTLVALRDPVRYMTTDAFFAWLGDMDKDYARKTREVLAWLVMCGARKADAIRIRKLKETVKDLERRLGERDGIIESLQRNLVRVLGAYLGNKH